MRVFKWACLPKSGTHSNASSYLGGVTEIYDLAERDLQFTESLIQNKLLTFKNDLQIELPQILQGRRRALFSTELNGGTIAPMVLFSKISSL